MKFIRREMNLIQRLNFFNTNFVYNQILVKYVEINYYVTLLILIDILYHVPLTT